MGTFNDRGAIDKVIRLALLLLLALGLQLTVGTLSLDLLRFPLNLLLLLVGAVLLVEVHRRQSAAQNTTPQAMWPAAWPSLLMMVLVALTMGLQREPASSSWPVVVALLYVQYALGLAILRGWRNKAGIRWSFLLNHAGLWLALVGGFWGAPDVERLRLVAEREGATNEAFRLDGAPTRLDYQVRLHDFCLTTYANGSPASYEAEVEVDGVRYPLRVNHPLKRSFGELIYLISYDRTTTPPAYCILEVVHEPWRGVTVSGIVMMMLGALLTFVRGRRAEGHGPKPKNSIG